MRLQWVAGHVGYRRSIGVANPSPPLHISTPVSSSLTKEHVQAAWQQSASHTTAATAAAAEEVSRSLPQSLLRALAGGRFTVDKVSGAGRGLIAVRDIPQGQEVLREQPMLAVPAAMYMYRPGSSTRRARPGQVCYHCLGSLTSTSTQHPMSGQAFCSTACLEIASAQYHEVESRAQLQPLVELCAQSGTRMPLMAARLACQHITAHARSLANQASSSGQDSAAGTQAAAGVIISSEQLQVLQATGTAVTNSQQQPQVLQESATTQAAGQARIVQGDPLTDMAFLCHANVSKPYPEPWVQEWEMMASGLQPAVDWLAGQLLAGTHSHQPAAVVAAGKQHQRQQQQHQEPQPHYQHQHDQYQQRQGHQAALDAQQKHKQVQEIPQQQVTRRTSSHTGAASEQLHSIQQRLMQGLGLDWYVSVLSRLHVNTFRVDGIVLPPVMGSEAPHMWANDLASQAAALLLAAESGSNADSAADDAASEVGGGGGLGSALYLTASLLNHSCEPNLDVVFPRNNLTLAVRAARDIQAGEQLHISYLDNTQSLAARQQRLHFAYGFTCRCTLCQEQQAEKS